MPFPVSPNPGDSYTDAYGTVWIYAGSVNGWYRQQVSTPNDTSYTSAISGPAGSNTQVQFNDNGTLAGDSDLTWNKTSNVLGVTGDVNLSDGGTYTTTLQTITPTANRTVSIPDATGTLALVAGSSGQLLYNNAGANAGVSTMTFDGTSVTLAGRLINSYTSVASSPAKVFTGTWFTGGTSTTNKPHFLIEPTGTTSTAWSTSGTGLGVNAASGFAGRLFDFQVNGTSRAVLDSAGRLLVGMSSGRTAAGVQGRIQVETNDFVGLSVIHNANNTGGGNIVLGKSRGSSPGGVTIPLNGDFLGTINFVGADEADLDSVAATISALVDGGISVTAGSFVVGRRYKIATVGTTDFTLIGASANTVGVIFQATGVGTGTGTATTEPYANSMPGRIVLSTTADGAASPTERLRITNDGVSGYNQPAPVAVNTTATLTVGNLKTGIVTSSTAAAVTMTLPTGTLTEGGFSGLYNNFTFEWTVINTGATNAVTVQGDTGHTLVGSGTVAAGVSGRFASRRTAANTFVTYRLS